jgi:hypothetical protein
MRRERGVRKLWRPGSPCSESIKALSNVSDAGLVGERAILVTITDSSPDSITEIPQALIGVVGLFGV